MWPRTFILHIRQRIEVQNFHDVLKKELLADEDACVSILCTPEKMHNGKKGTLIWRGGKISVKDADCMHALIARAAASRYFDLMPIAV